MIIGNGLIAKTFDKYKYSKKILIFASGVSNSQETSISSFLREEDMLKRVVQESQAYRVVYFSSCDVKDESNNKPYYTHKRKMEELIINNSNNYAIFRLPQVIGRGGNNTNLINFLKNKIKNNEKFDLHLNHYKSIIHIKEVFRMCSFILDNDMCKAKVINIINFNYIKMSNLVGLIEAEVRKKSTVNELYDVKTLEYDETDSMQIAEKLKIKFDNFYITNSIRDK